MKKKKDWLSITPPLFTAGRIEFHTDSKRLIKHMRATDADVADDFLDYSAGACIYDSLPAIGVLYIYVGDGKLTTLVHECFHAAVRYLAYMGVPLETDKANETYAYFLEHLVGVALPLIKV